jgi:ParB family chromosome partitioning protein
MAVTFNNATTKRTSTLVVDYPENILLDPEINGRVEVTSVEDLAADIEKNGQNTPALIRKNDKGQPVLVTGHRRWRAVKLINERRAKNGGGALVQLECRYEQLTDEEAFTATISENRFRKDVTAVDDAHNIAVLQKRYKRTIEDIAAIYFPEAGSDEAKAEAVRWVKNRVALQELAPEAEQAVRDGEVKITAAVQLAALSKDQQREVIAASKAKGENLKGKTRVKVSTIKAAKGHKAPAPGKKAAAKAAPAPVAPKVASSVYEAAEGLAVAVDAWITDATDKAEKSLLAAHKAYRKLVPAKRHK